MITKSIVFTLALILTVVPIFTLSNYWMGKFITAFVGKRYTGYSVILETGMIVFACIFWGIYYYLTNS